MRLLDLDVCDSPRDSSAVRLRGRVAFGAGDTDEIWFDVDSAGNSDLSVSGNPWLACLAPVAAALGEPLRIDAPVDSVLHENVCELLRIWTAWYPALHAVPLEVMEGDTPLPSDRRTIAFFSGGVDSFFTALRHNAGDGTPRNEPIDDLVFVRGFDIPVAREQTFREVGESLERAAAELGCRLVRVATNLRETRFARADWSKLSHGAALAAVGLALEPVCGTVLIPSSAGYRDLRPWGSHPLTDPLFSTSSTRVVHDGPAFMRVEKTAYIARSDVASRALRVCWRSEDGWNCGACNNCYRTMLTLEALGVLDRFVTFDRSKLAMRRAERVYCPETFDIRQFGYVRDLAEREGRTGIVQAVDRSLAGSARLRSRISFLRRLRDRPVIWRWAPRLEKRLLRDWLV